MIKLKATANAGSDNSDFSSSMIKMPKMPAFKDGEDITSYFIRFEQMAKMCGWPPESWATRLGLLFQGDSLKVYSSLPPETMQDYDELKKAILRAYKRTPDQYRKDFRFAKIGHKENYSQFLVSLYRLFDYWVKSTNIEETYNALRDLVVGDQFMTSLPNDVRLFVKEHDKLDPKEMARLADNYASAHKTYPRESKGKTLDRPVVKSEGKAESTKVVVQGRKCFSCGASDHLRNKCPKNPAAERANINNVNMYEGRAPMGCGTINGSRVSTILRDTGCSGVVVSEEVLPNINPVDYPKAKSSDYLGRWDTFPVVRCFLDCQWYKGWVNAVRAPIKHCAVLLGNIPGASFPTEEECIGITSNVELSRVNVVTRAQRKSIHPLDLPNVQPLDISHDEFKALQATCPTLNLIRQKCSQGETETNKTGITFNYVTENSLIYRTIVDSKNVNDIGKKMLVVPKECRATVLKLSHDLPVSGHFSHRKTLMKVRENFYWPNMTIDVYRYCRSCDRCQKNVAKGRVKAAPLVKMSIFTVPFERVAVDIVGPLKPVSSEGHQYILTLIDYATSFPEAAPLKNITSIDVAEALMTIFSRVGIPKEILSDRGSQFTSDLMGKVYDLVGVKPLFTTPYHPMCNGRIERQHSILKSILKKLCIMKPKEWHRYLSCALFAMREIPSDSLGFSPFEMLYGRQVRGPLSILHELWANPDLTSESKSSYQFVFELREKLEETAELAAQNQDVAMNKYKTYFDLKSSSRQFKVDDEVLVLLPDSSSKLLMTWKGPYKIIKAQGKVDYLIDMHGKPKLLHVNLLKRYHRRADTTCLSVINEDVSYPVLTPFQLNNFVNVCVLEAEDNLEDNIITVDLCDQEEVNISSDLTEKQVGDLNNLLVEFKDVFSIVPGCTDTVMHEIRLTTREPVRKKIYPVPIRLRDDFDMEVDKLLELDIIEPSHSSFCSPVVMVKKPDNSYRLTQDYRALNAVTQFDSEPMPAIEDDLHKFSGCKYISEIDITKAYHQIKLHPNSRAYTAFPTSKGLMQYKRMPFGLVTACASYIRLMRKVLDSVPNVSVYFDNIYVISASWIEHLDTLRIVLERLRSHGLTARPSKCNFAFSQIKYLGFVVGNDEVSPSKDKITALCETKPPTSKKQLRSFLGMISFYRKFLPNLASLTAPLSDLLKKEVKEPLPWNESLNDSFEKIKTLMINPPILMLPDVTKPFCVRTDASSSGLGAVLLQYKDNIPRPVAYASKKLLDREKRYSTVERECYAIVWALAKFRYYLYGREFLLETDHRPLVYLETFKGNNGRLMRWALSLQPYKFRIIYISGAENHGADLLSRS